MADTNVITARIDDATFKDLTRLAGHYDRSKAWLVAKAVRSYVKQETEFLAFLQQGEDSINRGDFLTQEEMVDWVRSLDRRADAA